MSANDWEKSWKNHLDKYESPVDSGLFEAITSKATVKTGGSFIFGWIGLGVVVLSSVLFIAGFKSNNKQLKVENEYNSETLQASISKQQTNLAQLLPEQYETNVPFEISNSGKYVSTHFVNNKTTSPGTGISNEKPATNLKSVKSHGLTANENIIKQTAEQSIANIEIPFSNNQVIEHNSIAVSSETTASFEDAKIRLSAAEPFSVLFDVKSKYKGLTINMPDPDDCFNDARGRSSFYLDAYVGAGNSIRSLSAVEGQEIYRNMRDSLENSWYNSAVGARIGFILSSGMAIETGAEYQVHNEIFEYKNESEVRITYKYHYDQFGDVTRIDTITEIGARTLRTHNKYQQINIPLRLGYTMEKGRWMLGARLGLGLHIWNHQHGVILDNTYQTYRIEDDPQEYFNKNWGMQFNASLQIGYRILPQTFLMIEPTWNSQSKGITRLPYTIEQKYQTMRLNVGIRFVPGSY